MKSIKDEKQYKAIMARIDELIFETDENTSADDIRLEELNRLSALVEEFERKHYPIETKSQQPLMRNLTPIEDLITEDFGPIGSPQRDQFEKECTNWLIKNGSEN